MQDGRCTLRRGRGIRRVRFGKLNGPFARFGTAIYEVCAFDAAPPFAKLWPCVKLGSPERFADAFRNGTERDSASRAGASCSVLFIPF